MNPVTGQRVKIFFRSGLVEEGVVVSWTEQRSVLKSLSSDNLLVIMDTVQDIVAVKIFVEQEKLQTPAESESTPPTPNTIYIDQELELPVPERNLQFRAKKLAELRIMRAEEERNRARSAMTTFHNTGNFSAVSMEKYAQPTRLQESPNFDSPEKNRPGNPRRHR